MEKHPIEGLIEATEAVLGEYEGQRARITDEEVADGETVGMTCLGLDDLAKSMVELKKVGYDHSLQTDANIRYMLSFLGIIVSRAGGKLAVENLGEAVGMDLSLEMDLDRENKRVVLRTVSNHPERN